MNDKDQREINYQCIISLFSFHDDCQLRQGVRLIVVLAAHTFTLRMNIQHDKVNLV